MQEEGFSSLIPIAYITMDMAEREADYASGEASSAKGFAFIIMLSPNQS
jgi:hypothetical protein